MNAASITINVSNSSIGSYELYEVLTDWNEAEANWTAARNGIPWVIAGAQGVADRGSDVLGTVTASSIGIYQLDLNANGVAVVQDWVNGVRPNHGFVLANVATIDGVDFDSREAFSTTGRPKLSVTYSLPGGSTDTVLSFQDGVFPDAAYDGTRDVSLVESLSNTNVSSERDLFLDGDDPSESGNDIAALLFWDISLLSSDAQVNAASITINVSNSSIGSYELYEVLTDWNEAEANWTAARNGIPWVIAGAQGVADRGSDVLGTVTASSIGIYQLDLNANGVAVVQDWVNGVRPNHGFVLANAATIDGVDFDSREASTAVTRPKLTINYTPSATNPSTSETFYYHTDHLGAPQVLTDATQSVAWKADYDPFGRASITVETIENNVRFPGQYFDQETGLHYNHHRYYSPEIGRYITSDPIGLLGGLNTYSYALSNPIMYYDPYGLWVPPSLPQGVVDGSAGLGDGIIATLTLGFASGQGFRDNLGVDGGVNICASAYYGGRLAGTTGTLAAQAFGAIPAVLTHFTTRAGAAGIAASGTINASKGAQLFGGGKYASSVGGFPRNPFVPAGSTVPIAINNTSGFVRAVPGTFLQPTGAVAAQLGSMNAAYGAVANRDVFNSDCECQ